MGRIVTVVENQRFSFSSLAGSCKATVPLAKGMDLGMAARVRVLVRVHEAVIPTNAYFEVQAFQAWPTPDDPKELYELVAPGAAGTRAAILKGKLPQVDGSAATTPAVYLAVDGDTGSAFAESVGPTVDLYLEASPGASAATFTCGITVALELWDA